MKTERKRRRGNQTWVIYHLNYCRDKPKPDYFSQTFFCSIDYYFFNNVCIFKETEGAEKNDHGG